MTPAAVRVALIEIGTNSTKLLIADARRGAPPRHVHFETRITRIGRDLEQSGRIPRAGLDATLDVIDRFERAASRHRAAKVFACATFAMRSASNASAVARRISRAAGVPLKILTGKEEAHFAYLGARGVLQLSRPETLLVDIGGGSTELVLARRGRVVRACSIPLGALHLTDRFISTDPVAPEEFARLEAHIDRSVRGALTRVRAKGLQPRRLDLVASGGSIMTTARVIAGGVRRRRPVLRRGDVAGFLERCLALTLAQRKRIRGLEPERADIIPAGVAVALAVMRGMRKRALLANPGGVRAGVLAHLSENDFEW